jgi:hypothetical protein
MAWHLKMVAVRRASAIRSWNQQQFAGKWYSSITISADSFFREDKMTNKTTYGDRSFFPASLIAATVFMEAER